MSVLCRQCPTVVLNHCSAEEDLRVLEVEVAMGMINCCAARSLRYCALQHFIPINPPLFREFCDPGLQRSNTLSALIAVCFDLHAYRDAQFGTH